MVSAGFSETTAPCVIDDACAGSMPAISASEQIADVAALLMNLALAPTIDAPTFGAPTLKPKKSL